jgi:ABC-type branched-subunit amino acid transport system substrate-binding protein
MNTYQGGALRKICIAAIAALLVVSGCTSGDDEDSGTDAGTTTTLDGASGDTSTTAEVPTGPAPGVTDDAIKVGVTYVDLEAIRELTNLDHGDYEAAYRALFDDINAKGGINGRKIEPVFAPINPVGTQPAEEACVKLTQDEEVFVVLGFFQADAVLCYIETHETAVIGGTMTPDRLQRSTVPWFTAEPSSDLEADTIRQFAADGLLDGSVAVVSTLQDETALHQTVEPLLDELGVDPVETAVIDAPENDVAAQNAAVAVIAERFRSAGATKVLVVGTGGLTWANGVESTGFRPQLLFTNVNSISAYTEDAAGRDDTVLEGSVVGGLYGPATDSFHTDSMQGCLATLQSAGITVGDPADIPAGEPEPYVSAFNACRNVALFQAIAEAAGEQLDYGTFRQAGDELGEITIPGYPDPFTYGAQPSADGDPAVYVFEWDPQAGEFARRD